MLKNKNGFSLVELMIIIVILGILVGIAVLVFPNTKSNAEETTCQAVRYQVIRQYQTQVQVDSELLLETVLLNTDNKYFSNDIRCPAGGELTVVEGKIVCSIHGNSIIDANSSASFKYDFSNMSEEELSNLMDLVISQGNDEWEITDVDGRVVLTNKTTGENRIFFPVEFSEYTLISNIELTGSNGYGIMIESVTDNAANDSGYVFQFDPGYGNGEFIFRERVNGRERSPFERIKPEDVIPDYDEDTFWNDEHEIKIDIVSYSDTQNQMVVYIDNVNITAGEPVYIDIADDDAQNYVGFRTWGSSHALIDDLEVITNE